VPVDEPLDDEDAVVPLLTSLLPVAHAPPQAHTKSTDERAVLRRIAASAPDGGTGRGRASRAGRGAGRRFVRWPLWLHPPRRERRIPPEEGPGALRCGAGGARGAHGMPQNPSAAQRSLQQSPS
jgi:hypothetical protein